MRLLIAIATMTALSTGLAIAQSKSTTSTSPDSSERTDLKAHQQHRERQPQGPTGPLDTTTGGPPAASPQGQSPPGMQSAPEGSSKTIVDTEQK
jgi:hypothetical protein